MCVHLITKKLFYIWLIPFFLFCLVLHLGLKTIQVGKKAVARIVLLLLSAALINSGSTLGLDWLSLAIRGARRDKYESISQRVRDEMDAVALRGDGRPVEFGRRPHARLDISLPRRICLAGFPIHPIQLASSPHGRLFHRPIRSRYYDYDYDDSFWIALSFNSLISY